MALCIVSYGFSVEPIYDFIRVRGVWEDDQFLFITVEDDAGGNEVVRRRRERAREMIEVVMRSCYNGGVVNSYSFEEVDDSDILTAIKMISDLVSRNAGEDTNIVVGAVSGTKTLIASLILYSHLDPRVSKLYAYNDKEVRVVDVPIITRMIPNFKANVRRIRDDLRDLDKGRDIDKRKLRVILRQGLAIKPKGRGSKAEIDDKGRVFLDILDNLPL